MQRCCGSEGGHLLEHGNMLLVCSARISMHHDDDTHYTVNASDVFVMEWLYGLLSCCVRGYQRRISRLSDCGMALLIGCNDGRRS